jgi:hypothetical protein
VILLLIASLGFNTALLVTGRRASSRDAHADTDAGVELSPYMATMQQQAHKLGLAIQAQNQPLAGFYAEELGETIEIIEKTFPLYDDVMIAELAGAMFEPSLPPLVKAIASSQWPAATAAYEGLISACNDCHGAANHEFIEVVTPAGNPFNQSFSKR